MPRITVEGELGQTVKIYRNRFGYASVFPETTFQRPWLTNEGREMLQAGIQPPAETFTAKITDEIKAGSVCLRGNVKTGLFFNVIRGPLKIRIPVPNEEVNKSPDTQQENISGIGAASV